MAAQLMLSGPDTQIAAFLQRMPDDVPDMTVDEPQVVFRTAMELTREQEDRLVEQFFQRKQDIETEMGRSSAAGSDWWQSFAQNGLGDDMTFLAKRALMELVYHQKMEWRRWVCGGIFDTGQNVHMPFCRRIVQQMIARANNYFFSTDPYFSVNPMPAPGVDPDKAGQADAFAKYKFERAGVKPALEKAVEKAFIRGEAVVKTRHWSDVIRYETNAKIAVQSPGGAALLAQDQDYIYDTDRWVNRPQLTPEQQADADQAQREGQPLDMSQFPMAMTLERDANTPLPATPLVFELRHITRMVTRYNGPQAVNVHAEDFLMALNSPDVQSADCAIHLYSIPAIELVQIYIDRLKAMGQYDPQEFPRVLELLRTAPLSSGESGHAATTAPRPELGEANTSLQKRADPALSIAEAYLRMDVNGDGQYEEVFLMIDINTRRPIIYDHLPNVFPNSRRPFHVMVINPVEGRWHGIGMMEVFWEIQKFIDLTYNRWDVSCSQAGAVTLWTPELTVEGAANPALRLNTGETYRKRNRETKAEDIIEQVWLHQFKSEDLHKLVQFATQLLMNMSGVTSVNDAQAAGLETGKLATGVRNMDMAGQEQFAPFLSHLEPGITSVLESLLYLTLWHMDEVELYHVLQNGKPTPMAIQAIDVRDLQYEVSLELSEYRNQQEVAQSQAARACALTFYNLPLVVQQRLMPLFKTELKAYGIEDTDAMLQPLDLQGQQLQQSSGDTSKSPIMPPPPAVPGQSHGLT